MPQATPDGSLNRGVSPLLILNRYLGEFYDLRSPADCFGEAPRATPFGLARLPQNLSAGMVPVICNFVRHHFREITIIYPNPRKRDIESNNLKKAPYLQHDVMFKGMWVQLSLQKNNHCHVHPLLPNLHLTRIGSYFVGLI